MLFRENVPLAPYTTFRIGGPARWFADAASEDDILEGVAFARDRQLTLFILGGGSNLLVSDQGFPGLVLHIVLRGVSDVTEGDKRIFSVAAGEDWDSFVTHAVDLNCGGVECLAGIPGTVGGTPVQNVGAYGQQVADTIRNVRALDRNAMQFVTWKSSECGFAYRQSRFNSTEKGQHVVVGVDFDLPIGAPATLNYVDLKQRFKDSDASPSLRAVSNAVREIRRKKGMLLVEGDPDCRSAGSFFKNPIVPEPVYRQIRAAYGEVPNYAAAPGLVKIPAAWLLEHAGFAKGYGLGQAGISSRHALALINRGAASAADILSLRDHIVKEIEDRFSIRLEPEPVLVF